MQTSRGLLHHGNLGIVRSLGRLGVPVYVFQDAHWAPAARSRYVRGSFVGGFRVKSAEDTIASLLEVGQRLGSRAILIPTDDAGALFVSEHDAALSTTEARQTRHF